MTVIYIVILVQMWPSMFCPHLDNNNLIQRTAVSFTGDQTSQLGIQWLDHTETPFSSVVLFVTPHACILCQNRHSPSLLKLPEETYWPPVVPFFDPLPAQHHLYPIMVANSPGSHDNAQLSTW